MFTSKFIYLNLEIIFKKINLNLIYFLCITIYILYIYIYIYATQTVEKHNLKTYRSTPLIQLYGALCVVYSYTQKIK